MGLNCKIGDIVHAVDVRNSDLQCDNLLGLSMTKEFRPSTSNIVGTDLSKYKIVGFNEFAVDFMSAIRVHKMPIALNRTGSDIIVSPAYGVFAVNDEDVVLPEYLMLWFMRPDFDRYADFKSDSAIRGGYDWHELCNTEINLPSISEQRKIVHDYQVITDRIELLRKMNEKLETVCNTYFDSISEIASQRGSGHLEDYINFGNGKARPSAIGVIPVYGGNGIMSYTDEYNEENVTIIGRVGAYCGSVFVEEDCCWVSDNAIVANSKVAEDEYFDYCLLKQMNLYSHHVGTGQQLLTQGILNAISCAAYTKDEICGFNQTVKSIFKNMRHYGEEISKLEKLLLILLSSLAVETKSEVSA